MRNFLLNLKEKLSNEDEDVEEMDEYVELGSDEIEGEDSKVIVRPFTLEQFDDVKKVLDALREGYTIALVNISPLKDEDLIELKRAVNKLKKTCEAIEGDVAGFGEDYIIAVPEFAEVYRGSQTEEVQEQ